MPLTQDQIKKLWLAEQEINNPRYTLMSANDKATFEATLNDYYTQNSQVITNKYNGNNIDMSVSDGVSDDSERTPFSTKQGNQLIDTYVSPDQTIPVYDDIHWRIIWWVKPVYDVYSNIIKKGYVTEVWIYDSPPSDSAAILLDKIVLDNSTKEFQQVTNDGIPNIDELDGLLFNNTYLVANIDSINKAWIPITNPLDRYLYWKKERKGWIAGFNTAALSGGITSQQVINGLTNSIYDPLHPESIHAGWIYEKTINKDTQFTRSLGGPVISNVKLNLLFIGNVTQKKNIIQFHTDLFSNVQYMNVIAQYGINSGQVTNNDSITVNVVLTNYLIQQYLQGSIDNGNLLQPDEGTFYICYIESYDNKEYHDFFKAKNGYNCRYGVIGIPQSPDMDNITPLGSKILINGITDPEFNAWNNNDVELCDQCPYSGRVGIWLVNRIWDVTNKICSLGSSVKVLFPNSNAISSNLFTTYIWRMTELETINNSFRLQVNKQILGTVTSWYIQGVIANLSYNDWVTKYIAPYFGNLASGAQLETIQQIPSFNNIQDVIDSLNASVINKAGDSAGIVANIIGNNGTSALIQVNNNQLIYYELYLNLDKGWIFIVRFVSFPSENQIENAINYRSKVFNAGDRQITWTSNINGYGNLTGQVSNVLVKSIFQSYNIVSPDPTDPNMLYGSNRYFVQKFNEDLYLWIDKAYPWQWELKAKLGQLDRTSLTKLFWGDRYDLLYPSTPDTFESNDPSLLNPYWSVESTSVNLTNGNTLAVWNLGASCGDPHYRLIVELVPWRDLKGHIGVTATPIAYIHTALDGVVRQVTVQRGFLSSPNTTTDHSGFQYEQSPNVLFLPNEPLFKLYYDTYTSGKSILPNITNYGNTQPLLIQTASVYGFHNVSEVLARYTDFTLISETADDILIQGITKDSVWNIKLYFKYIPYIQWAPPAIFPAGFEKNVGGVFLHQMYLMNKGVDIYEAIP